MVARKESRKVAILQTTGGGMVELEVEAIKWETTYRKGYKPNMRNSFYS